MRSIWYRAAVLGATCLVLVACGSSGDIGPVGPEGSEGPAGPPGTDTARAAGEETCVTCHAEGRSADAYATHRTPPAPFVMDVDFLNPDGHADDWWAAGEQLQFQFAFTNGGNKPENTFHWDLTELKDLKIYAIGPRGAYSAAANKGGSFIGEVKLVDKHQIKSASGWDSANALYTLTVAGGLQPGTYTFLVRCKADMVFHPEYSEVIANADIDFQVGTDVVSEETLSTDTCVRCHEDGADIKHGGFTASWCNYCHAQGLTFKTSGMPVDTMSMVHRLHAAEETYVLWEWKDGAEKIKQDAGDMTFPGTGAQCTTCHTETRYADNPTAWSCGTCHAEQYVLLPQGAGTPTGGTTSSLTDTTQTWTVDEHVGRLVTFAVPATAPEPQRTYSGWITSNSADTLFVTFRFGSAPNTGGTYEIGEPAISHSGMGDMTTGCTGCHTPALIDSVHMPVGTSAGLAVEITPSVPSGAYFVPGVDDLSFTMAFRKDDATLWGLTDLERLVLYVSGPARAPQLLALGLGSDTVELHLLMSDGSVNPDYASVVTDNGDGTLTYRVADFSAWADGTYHVSAKARTNATEKDYETGFNSVQVGTDIVGTRSPIVTLADCNACHDGLAKHANAHTVEGCLVCHVSGNELDGSHTVSGLPADLVFGTMIHNLHNGDLDLLKGGEPRKYVGMVFPQSMQHCAVCHPPEWMRGTRAGCLSCHTSLDAFNHAEANVYYPPADEE
jgi:hypothetical protein